MSLCIATAGKLLTLAIAEFSLSWTHSVERIRWEETWHISDEGLRPVLAVVLGSGAGMEIPEGAKRIDGAWHYEPKLAPQKQVVLAASGMTQGAWQLCAEGQCYELGAKAGETVTLFAEACESLPDGLRPR